MARSRVRRRPEFWPALAVSCLFMAPARADEAAVVEALQRRGAVVRRDQAKPDKPVVAVLFGIRPLIPETASETLKEGLLTGFPVPKPDAVQVSDADLSRLSQLKDLQVLDLCCAPITNKALTHLQGLPKLQVLDLRKTGVNDQGLELIGRHQSLKKLYLSSCPITDEGLKHLAKLTSLEVLVLGRTNVSDEGVKHLASLPHVQKLYLHETKISDQALKVVQKLKNLKELALSGTSVSDEGVKQLRGLDNLRKLYLNASRVTDAGLPTVGAMKQLEALSLTGTTVTDEGLRQLAALQRLRSLQLGWTRITDAGLRHLAGLRELRELVLVDTQTTPEEVATLKKANPRLEVCTRSLFPPIPSPIELKRVQPFEPVRLPVWIIWVFGCGAALLASLFGLRLPSLWERHSQSRKDTPGVRRSVALGKDGKDGVMYIDGDW